MPKLPLPLLLTLCLLPVFAAESPAASFGPFQVRDINQEPLEAGSSSPTFLGKAGGRSIFVTLSQGRPRDLWASDGTASGTRLLKPFISEIRGVAQGGGRLFFVEGVGSQRTLWATDGTVRGTRRLSPPGVTFGDRQPFLWNESLGLLFFWGHSFTLGSEVWVSDGTPEGTRMIVDLFPGNEFSSYTELALAGDMVIFPGRDAQHGVELWRTDGTAAGTVLVKDLAPGQHSSIVHGLASGGDKVFFVAYASPGYGLWVTDGTTRGTAFLRAFDQGEDFSRYIAPVAVAPGRLYFVAERDSQSGSELWTSDGSPGGTRKLVSLPATTYTFGQIPSLRFFSDASLLFFADDGVHGMEPWRSDGTVAGTRIVKDVCPGSCGSYYPLSLPVSAGEKIYVQLWTPTHGTELWSTNGTGPGTRMILDICPGACSSGAYAKYVMDDLLLFGAWSDDSDEKLNLWRTDGTAAGTFALTQGHLRSEGSLGFLSGTSLGNVFLFGSDDGVHGRELWASDGTVAGTRLLKDIAGASQAGSNPLELTAVGNQLFFVADDAVHGPELWKSDGTAGGTTMVEEIAPGTEAPPYTSLFSRLTAWNGRLLFTTLTEGGDELWASDGTAAGTGRLSEVVPKSLFTPFQRAGGRLFFFTQDELWTTDATPGGTARVKTDVTLDYYAEVEGYLPHSAELGGQLLFRGANPRTSDQRGLWKTDGTAAGTSMIMSMYNLSGFTRLGNQVFFSADDSEIGTTLYKSDGTAQGTGPVVDLIPGRGGANLSWIAAAGSQLFFVPESTEYGSELWVSDGTEAGTRLVKDIVPGHASSGISDLIARGNQVFFVADDGTHGRELWRSDGTEAGTVMVKDIHPGYEASSPDGLVEAQGVLLFTANDGEHGIEIWQTDGTREGTVLVHDLVPGAASSSPEDLTPAGPLVFFRADDGVAGPELWALCSSPRPRVEISNPSVREAAGGAVATFTVALSNPFCAEISVGYATADGSARAGSDYAGVSGTLTFPPGTTSRTVEVTVLDDSLAESTEAFSLLLSAIRNAEPGTGGRASISDDDQNGGPGEEGALTAEQVACDAARLSGLLVRLDLEGERGPGVNLSFTASGDFAGLAYTGDGSREPERHLTFSTNPEETTLLRNPQRPQLASVSMTRNALGSDLVAGTGAVRLLLNPTLDASPAPASLLTLDNVVGAGGNPTSSRPGRGIAPLLSPCHDPFPAADVHVFRVLTKLARAEAPGAGSYRLAIFRGEAPGRYRIDVYPVAPGGGSLGRLSAELEVSLAADGSLSAGTLRLLGPCAGGATGGCTDASLPVILRLVRPAPSGAAWSEAARVGSGAGEPMEQGVDWGALLAATSWSAPLDLERPAVPETLDESTVACEAGRLEQILGRLQALATRSDKSVGVNIATTQTGDFAGIAYTSNGPGTAEHHLAFSTNPEESTLLRNPERPQLFSLSFARNPLNSDLVPAGAADELRLTLNPTLSPSPDPAALLAVDNVAGSGSRPSDAKPGRGLADLLVPCHRGLAGEDVHVLRVLSKIVRAEAAGASAFEIALFRGPDSGQYRIDVYPLAANGGPLGRLAAEVIVNRALDGSLSGGTLRLLGRCAAPQSTQCTNVPGFAAVQLVRPAASGTLWPPSLYRVFTNGSGGGGQSERPVDWTDLLGGTTWSRP